MNTPRHHDEELRVELIAAASKALAKGGPAAVSLRDVSAACNTSTTAVYSLFGGKKQLLDSVVVTSAGDLAAHLTEVSHDQDPENYLVALGIALHDWAVENPELFDVIFNQADQVPDRAAQANGAPGTAGTKKSDVTSGSIGTGISRRDNHLLAAFRELGTNIDAFESIAKHLSKAMTEGRTKYGATSDTSPEDATTLLRAVWASVHGWTHLEIQGFIDAAGFNDFVHAMVKAALKASRD
ncbi:TetR/AcrR family transcriptional regulator [Dermabacter sp. p3-SID358]|uniref:TetR/AcrR family transcriptional regulator n=1 Tax=Dermabacter sp. p3-SID358 TaxID=2916114 RepID=UPI0021A31891|nr:TetR/AcrR family transcriptional regulator [Dermabacter sp. p3-SID358]MCT1867191.1 TetR/AcrR family transcriptional regulator [Dermabacter sp. p3-SID358]